MILQKDIAVIRTRQNTGIKYQYQLFIEGTLRKQRLSNHECRIAEVTINPGTNNIIMDLFRSTNEVEFSKIEDNDLFIIPITIKS